MAGCRALGKRLAVMFFLALRAGGIDPAVDQSHLVGVLGMSVRLRGVLFISHPPMLLSHRPFLREKHQPV